MASNTDRQMVVALDIGTSKIVALVAEIDEAGEVELIGMGTHRSQGMKKGVVVNIDSTVTAIRHAVEEAERMAGVQVHSVFAGIAGSHIRSMNSHGIVAIKTNEVEQNDIDRVVDAAKAVAIPADQRIIHVLPQEYAIDDQDGITQPLGMSGVRLEARVHLVTGSISAAQNIVKCIRLCDLECEEIILEQIASSHSVLTDDEKDLGVVLVDMGGGTTDIAVFTEGAIRHTAVIPVAGDQVTNDIAVAFRTPTQFAEEIKVKYACALKQLASAEDMIEVPGVGDRNARRLARQTLAGIVEMRYEELLTLVNEELTRYGFDSACAAGVVLTGGTSKMEGVVELAEEIFHMPVRLGVPQHVNGLAEIARNPIHATGVGLLLYGQQRRQNPRSDSSDTSTEQGLISRMMEWFRSYF
ncbi:MAG: cell division protein FtsA [Gammaproteobacteria bacterium]|nr:MAG: cell division protein FtsA [Gammaproteobacteria bacterium]